MADPLDTRAALRRIEAVASAIGYLEARVEVRPYRGPGSRSDCRGYSEAALSYRQGRSLLRGGDTHLAATPAAAVDGLLARVVARARARIEYDRAEAARYAAEADALAARLAAALESRDG